MKDFRPLWKEQANTKSLSFYDCIQRCLMLGMHAGNDFDEKVQIAMRHLDKSFTKSSVFGYNRLENALRIAARPYLSLAGQVLETDSEKIEFEQIANAILKPETFKKLGVYYCYIFMFGELIPEQTLVQGMHAAMLMGQTLTENKAWPKGTSADNLHFVIARTDSSSELIRQLVVNGIQFCRYDDHDYSFDKEDSLVASDKKSLKTIMTYPVPAWKKPFEELELLRFESDRPNQRTV